MILGNEQLRREVADALATNGLKPYHIGAPGQRLHALVVIADAPDRLDNLPIPGGDCSPSPSPSVMLLASRTPCYSRAQAIDAGAEDLFVWPDDSAELIARARAVIRRRSADLDLHPLTGLPGGAALQRRLEEGLKHRGKLAVLGLDLCHFKAFNDCYGFQRGDQVLLETAEMLQMVAGEDGIVYHIGGDDYFIITSPGKADDVATRAVEAFADRSRSFYDADDASRGFLTALDRATGEPVRFPLMTLTVACATNEAEDVAHVGQLSRILAELKEYARAAGRQYARDRRAVHDVGRALRIKHVREHEADTGG
ncbi:MAG: GGDEF domain-containing protein [Armatimonadetes bacterium]|nr:GGDEF domain-containing protein [Armatimonadota bacterium]